MEKTIGVLLIGAGRAGMIHGRNFATSVPGAKLVAISDVFEEGVKAAAAEVGVEDWYTDYKEALKNPKVDAVAIATPTGLHKQIVIDCANAGKDIFCEKPMAMTAEECTEMIEACEKNHVKLQIGFIRRFDASFMKAKEYLETGKAGKMVEMISKTHGPSTPKEWMYDISVSNGPLAEVGSHDIYTLLWFTGAHAKSVYTVGGNYRCPQAKEKYPDFYDTALMTIKFDNGMIGLVDVAQGVQYGYDAQADILCEHGLVHAGDLRDVSAQMYTADGRESGVSTKWIEVFTGAYLREDIAFIQAVRGEKECEPDGYMGREVISIIKAGNESLKTGKIVEL